MKRFGSRKTNILAISLSAYFCLGVASCPKNVPEPPEHWECQFNGNPRAFYCENSVTFEQIKVPLESKAMKGAQCLPPNDVKIMSAYWDDLIRLAKQRCK